MNSLLFVRRLEEAIAWKAMLRGAFHAIYEQGAVREGQNSLHFSLLAGNYGREGFALDWPHRHGSMGVCRRDARHQVIDRRQYLAAL
jgi:hypothetical protein